MKLEYSTTSRGPAVVLLHGFPLNRAIWDDQSAALSDAYQVITPDLRGMGASPAPDGTVTMDSLADDVVELLDDLGVDGPVVVGGLSMGGYVVLSLMERLRDRLRGVMLIDTRAAADSAEAAGNRRTLADRVESQGAVSDLVESFLPKVLGKTTLSERPALVERVRQIMGATPSQGAAACLRGMADRPDRRGILPQFDRPALIIVGEEDTLTPPDEARDMALALPRATLEVVPRAGHLSCMENPRAVTEAMRAFLTRLS
jgi:pimeloyl-ACP methyl ester carboxylesterase